MPNFTIEPGRHIYVDGKPFISIGREGETYPAYADAMAAYITGLLNEAQADPREIYEARVAEYRRVGGC